MTYTVSSGTLNSILYRVGGKVAYGPRKNPLGFDSNPDHLTLGLGLWLTFHVTPVRTVLHLGEGRVVPTTLGMFWPAFVLQK